MVRKQAHPKVARSVKASKPAVAGVRSRYVEAIGRRKTAVAQVRLYDGKTGAEVPAGVHVNGQMLTRYFPLPKHRQVVLAPFAVLSLKDYRVTVKVGGGGTGAQAEAVRLGIARALVASDPSLRPRLKAHGYLTRDPRMVERKKPGLRKARRPQQWRKR